MVVTRTFSRILFLAPLAVTQQSGATQKAPPKAEHLKMAQPSGAT